MKCDLISCLLTNLCSHTLLYTWLPYGHNTVEQSGRTISKYNLLCSTVTARHIHKQWSYTAEFHLSLSNWSHTVYLNCVSVCWLTLKSTTTLAALWVCIQGSVWIKVLVGSTQWCFELTKAFLTSQNWQSDMNVHFMQQLSRRVKVRQLAFGRVSLFSLFIQLIPSLFTSATLWILCPLTWLDGMLYELVWFEQTLAFRLNVNISMLYSQ